MCGVEVKTAERGEWMELIGAVLLFSKQTDQLLQLSAKHDSPSSRLFRRFLRRFRAGHDCVSAAQRAAQNGAPNGAQQNAGQANCQFL